MSDDEGEGTRPGRTMGTAEASRLIGEHITSLKNDLASFKEGGSRTNSKREQDYEFAKKGNKHQFDFNEKVAGILEDALALVPSAPVVSAVTAGPSSSRGSTSAEAKLRNLLQQGIKLVDEQQKLIKMADRSEFGWGLVSEYLTDKLAENSEDER